MIRNLVFDIDDCLAPGSNEDIRTHWIPYFVRAFNISEEEARQLNSTYTRQYGCGATGFALERKLPNPHAWVEQVYAEVSRLSGETFARRHVFSPRLPELARQLEQKGYQLFTLTHGHHVHANRVLEHLQLAELIPDSNRFDRVRTYNVVEGRAASKLTDEPYRLLLKQANIRPRESIMVEDSAANLKAAAKMGFITVLVGENAATNTDSFVNYRYPSVESYLAVLARKAA